MADNDRPSEMHSATVENEEPTAVHQSPMNAPAAVNEPEVRIDWTASESTIQPADTQAASATQTQPKARAPKVERRREPRTPRPHVFVTITHWAMVLLLGLSFVTGIRLTWGYIKAPFHSWSVPLESIAPEGTLVGINIITLHVLISFFMIGVAGIYTAYMFRSGASRRLRVSRQTFDRIRQGAFERGFKWNKSSLWASNLLVYWLGFAFVVVLVLTGIAIYRVDWGVSALFGGYDTSRWIHSLLASVVHGIAHNGFGRSV